MLKQLRLKNKQRQPHYGDGVNAPAVGVLFRATELAGEVGEALNVVKKLERSRMGLKGSQGTIEDLSEELADVLICLDLLAAEYDIDLTNAVVNKFNKTSNKLNIPVLMEHPIDMSEIEIIKNGTGYCKPYNKANDLLGKLKQEYESEFYEKTRTILNSMLEQKEIINDKE